MGKQFSLPENMNISYDKMSASEKRNFTTQLLDTCDKYYQSTLELKTQIANLEQYNLQLLTQFDEMKGSSEQDQSDYDEILFANRELEALVAKLIHMLYDTRYAGKVPAKPRKDHLDDKYRAIQNDEDLWS